MISTELDSDEIFRDRKPFAVLATTLSYWLALAFVFVIPMESAVDIAGLGKLSRIVGLLMAACWLFAFLVTGKTRTPQAFHLLAFAFVLWNALSLLWTQDHTRSIDRVSTYLQVGVMLAIIWDLYTSPQRLRTGMQVYLCGSLVAAINTVYNYLTASEFYHQRFAAAGMHVDDLGINLALALPIAWYLAISSEETNGRYLILKFGNFLSIPVLIFAIFLTGTRSALLASTPAILYMLISVVRFRPLPRFILIAALISVLIAIFPFIPESSWQRMGTIGAEFSEGDLNGRTELWKRGLSLFANNPLLGTGSNSFPTVTGDNPPRVAHNSFISVLTETGLIGFGLIMAIGVLTLANAWSRPFWERLFWLSLLAVLIIGISTLTWEHRKPTWLVLSFAVIAGNFVSVGKSDLSEADLPPAASSD